MESSLGKNSENYENIGNKTNIYEQKPINIDYFNDVEEKQVKECVEKRKQKRREVAEKNKMVKKNKEKKTGGNKNKRKGHLETFK